VSIRIEGRLGGADINPYHLLAGIIAAGSQGIKEKIQPPNMFQGADYPLSEINFGCPKNLSNAIEIFEHSDFIRSTFGEHVQKEYTLHYKHQANLFESHVSDWEFQYYFDRI